MSYDGVVTRAIVTELIDKLKGGKIQKITQPSKNDIILMIYSNRESYKLFLSANNQEARVHLTSQKYENPIKPPQFCMVLRKYLNQGKIIDIKQNKLDRVIILTISSIDEMGFSGNKNLIVEIMGKYSNIILTDDNYTIIDSLKRVNENMSRVREVLPSLKYEFPTDDKINVLDENFDFDIEKLDQKLPNNEHPDKIFYKYYTGFSPTFGKEICYRSSIDRKLTWSLITEDEKQKLNQNFHNFIDKIKSREFDPVIVKSDKKYEEFYAFEITNTVYENIKLDSISKAVEEFYIHNKVHDRLRQMKNDLIKKLNSNVKTTNKKLKILNQNLSEEKKASKNQKLGDLLAANVTQIKKDNKFIEVNDFYDDNKLIKINLNPMKSPWENVNNYYKKSKKIKSAIEYAKKDIPIQKAELFYLEQSKDFIERSENIDQLEEVRQELIDNKIIKEQSRNKKKKVKSSKPIHYKTKTNSDIFIGRNSKQNDYLTLKMANKEDYFLHVRNLAGSHVILKPNGDVTEKDIITAAYLAAKNSSVSKEDKVEVDYTKKKNVNKPKNAKAGMVYYENFKTILVDMNTDFTKDLKLIEN